MEFKLKIFLTEKGFSLIEIGVVLLISITLLAFTLPISGAFSRQKLNAAASMMREDIRLTQKLCENQESSIYAIKFNRYNETYYIKRNTDIYKKIKLPAGINLMGTNFPSSYLTFKSDGGPVGFGGHVTLGDNKGNKLYVIVLSVTGRVRVDPSPPPP